MLCLCLYNDTDAKYVFDHQCELMSNWYLLGFFCISNVLFVISVHDFSLNVQRNHLGDVYEQVHLWVFFPNMKRKKVQKILAYSSKQYNCTPSKFSLTILQVASLKMTLQINNTLLTTTHRSSLSCFLSLC